MRPSALLCSLPTRPARALRPPDLRTPAQLPPARSARGGEAARDRLAPAGGPRRVFDGCLGLQAVKDALTERMELRPEGLLVGHRSVLGQVVRAVRALDDERSGEVPQVWRGERQAHALLGAREDHPLLVVLQAGK